MEKMVVYTSDRSDPGASHSVLRPLTAALALALGFVLFIGVLVLVVGFFLVAGALALAALGINRLLMLLSPRHRERQVLQGTFRPTSRVVETTARVIQSTTPKRRS
jgi:hypothetical protein